jgi:REP-associated tyrosine transposase
MGAREYLHRGHTVTDIKYHLVWATKYRYPLLKGALGLRVRDIVREVCEARDVRILKGAVAPDHVHILVASPASVAPSKLMQWVKGRSSRKLQQEFEHLRRRYWGQHLWARGYFCASAGTVTDEMIAAYIEHHTDGPDAPEFSVQVPE